MAGTKQSPAYGRLHILTGKGHGYDGIAAQFCTARPSGSRSKTPRRQKAEGPVARACKPFKPK
jgi:hypothetical protein